MLLGSRSQSLCVTSEQEVTPKSSEQQAPVGSVVVDVVLVLVVVVDVVDVVDVVHTSPSPPARSSQL